VPERDVVLPFGSDASCSGEPGRERRKGRGRDKELWWKDEEERE
jgi:hypothetical protein